MPISEVYNMDCMDYMKSIPDKHFDLAIVDPPYGGANSSVGRVKDSDKCLIGINRTGGTWAAKYGKKSEAGMKPPAKIISRSCSGFQSIKSFGAQIISKDCHPHDASWFGAS